MILNSFFEFSVRYTMVSAPDLLVLFSGSSLTSSTTTLFLVSPTFSLSLHWLFFPLISFAAVSLKPRLSHIFLQLPHQTLRAHQLLFRWPCFLLQPFFCFFIRTRLKRCLTDLTETEKRSSDTALRFKAISSHGFALSLLSFGWLYGSTVSTSLTKRRS